MSIEAHRTDDAHFAALPGYDYDPHFVDELVGFDINSAEMEAERGMTVYELDGAVDGQAYDIEVTAESRVLEVETGD